MVRHGCGRTGAIAFAFDVSWQWQLVWFCLLSLAAVLIALNYLRRNPLQSDRPLLNERAVQHIGQCYDLIDPIVNGRGSVKIGDLIWRVEGPELPKGSRVRVLGADGTLLKVTPAYCRKRSGNLDDVAHLTRDLRGCVIERPKRFGLALAASTLHFDLGEPCIGDLLRDHVVAGEGFEQAEGIAAR